VPTGFSLVGDFLVESTERVHVYAKKCGSSEPDDYTIAWANTTIFFLFLGCLSGVDSFDASPSILSNQSYADSGVVPSITTVSSNVMLLAIVGVQPSNDVEVENFTEIYDVIGSSLHYAFQPIAGASGDKTFEIGGYGSNWGSMMLALKPVSSESFIFYDRGIGRGIGRGISRGF
jgi:hypothetical protein